MNKIHITTIVTTNTVHTQRQSAQYNSEGRADCTLMKVKSNW